MREFKVKLKKRESCDQCEFVGDTAKKLRLHKKQEHKVRDGPDITGLFKISLLFVRVLSSVTDLL